MTKRLELIDFRHFSTVAKNKFFRLRILMDCMIFHHPMEKAIQHEKRSVKRVIHVNASENFQEEVSSILKLTLTFFGTQNNRILAPLAPSPTKASSTDLLQKETTYLNSSNQQPTQVTIRKSPKKRPLKRYTIVSSSSSTESLTSDTKGNQI